MSAAGGYPADVRSATDVVAVHRPCYLLAALGAELHALVIDRDVRVHGDDGAVGGVQDSGVYLLVGVVGGDQAYLGGLGAGEERFGARRFDGRGEAHLLRRISSTAIREMFAPDVSFADDHQATFCLLWLGNHRQYEIGRAIRRVRLLAKKQNCGRG
jgi:hypothetical protein